jgi:hypothetical protein
LKMKILSLLSLRTYLSDRTVSRLFVNGKQYAFTLEDIGRPEGIKVSGDTCIPEATYRVNVTESQRFKKRLPLIWNVTADKSIAVRGVTFTGVRSHNGVTPKHTEGCVLVGQELDTTGNLLLPNAEEIQFLIEQAESLKLPVLWTFAQDVEALALPAKVPA